MPRFEHTYCSQCGREFGPGDHGYSHCHQHGAGGREVITNHIMPPIPTNVFDWSACFDDYEPGEPIGYGPTCAAAIADLKEQVSIDTACEALGSGS